MRRAVNLAKQYWVLILFCALILFPLPYFLLWFYFIQAVPTPKTNYHEHVNQIDAEISDAERAWPIYRESMRSRLKELEALNRAFRVNKSPSEVKALHDRDPEAWTSIVLTVEGLHDVLEAVHHASSRTVLGLDLHPTYQNYSTEDQTFLFPHARKLREPWDYGDTSSDIPVRVRKSHSTSFVSTVLPHTDMLRLLHGLLAADLAIARQTQDSERVVKNVESGLGLARHFANKRLAVESLLAEICVQCFLDELQEIHADGATKFNEEQKVRLKRAIESIDVFALFEPAVECYANYDLVQRFYTNNENGDGHLTHDWLLLLRLTDRLNEGGTDLRPMPESTIDAIGEWVLRPFLIFAKPTRAEVMEILTQHEELLRQAWRPPYSRLKIQEACDHIKKARIPVGMSNNYDYFVGVYDRLVLLETKRRAILETLSPTQSESVHEVNQ